MIYVIAPNAKQFDLFCRLKSRDATERWPEGGYRYVTRPYDLLGYRGPVVIVNADQVDLLKYAEYHNDKSQPITYFNT